MSDYKHLQITENQKHGSLSLSLPFLVPVCTSSFCSFFVAFFAANALRTQQCHISLPWTSDMSVDILSKFYPAALEEVKILAFKSSGCVSNLHADIVSAYLVIGICGLLLGALSAAYSDLFRPIPFTAPRAVITKGILAMSALALVFVLVVTLFMNFGRIIYAEHGGVFAMLRLRGMYVNPWSYWLIAQLLMVLCATCLWLWHVVFALLYRINLKGS